jgi:hypothetical protein
MNNDQEVWLIEGAQVYWCGRSPNDFGKDVNEAVRFARQEDAERVLHWIVPEQMRLLCRTTGHMWSMGIERTEAA